LLRRTATARIFGYPHVHVFLIAAIRFFPSFFRMHVRKRSRMSRFAEVPRSSNPLENKSPASIVYLLSQLSDLRLCSESRQLFYDGPADVLRLEDVRFGLSMG